LLDDAAFTFSLAKRGINDREIKSFVDHDTQEIVIRRSLMKDHRCELLMHELMHACLEDSGNEFMHAEEFIRVLAPRFAALFRANLAKLIFDLESSD